MSAKVSQASDTTNQHWTQGITEVLEVTYKGGSIQASALVAIAVLTFASFVGLARYQAPLSAYLIVSGTGVLFGLLVRLRRWRKPTKSG